MRDAMQWGLLLAGLSLSCGGPEKPAAPPPTQEVVVTESDKCGFILDKIYFKENSASLDDRQAPILDATATMFRCMHRECRTVHIEVSGHASSSEASPETLSDARATTVADALLSRGVDRALLSSRAHAVLAPVDTRQNAMAFAKNQRVEFRVESTGC